MRKPLRLWVPKAWNFPVKVLDKPQSCCYNILMKKYSSEIIAFLLGLVFAFYVYPPTPQVELDDYDQEKIMWKVLDELEDAGYNVTKAKDAQTRVSSWW